MIERAKELLKSVFGFDGFISLQQHVIESVLGGRDCLAVMPTGGGKSLCYQIPALIFDGLTVVVSPLIALMKDQVEQLKQYGAPAVLLNSSISAEDYRRNVGQVRSGAARLLYVAPETLLRPNMLALLESLRVSCLAIDEAHCISEWGHDFRPEYRQLSDVRSRLPQAVCIALTATATPRVREDIRRSLGFDDSSEFVASFNRPNLLIRIVPKEKPYHQACELLRRYPNDSGIVYCSTRKQVDELCTTLASEGFSVCPYHAGLTDRERDRNQERFVRDEVRVIVATIAFGMGIDKSNIRFVLHYDLPKSIESYYQEIGRAGRDGLRAECMLLFSYGDIHKIRHWIKEKEGLERRAADLQLNAMLQLAESDVCRRIPLLAYFGEVCSREQCGMCDNCLAGERPMTDITVPAQKFLSCVKRTGERFGIVHMIDVLRGSRAEKILRFGHHKISTYGIGMDLSRRQWHQVARQMLHRGFMVQDPEIGGLSLTSKAWDVFRGQEAVLGRLDEAEALPASTGTELQDIAPAYDRSLFEALRRKRKELADEANVPPYVVFSDRTLTEMATLAPHSADSLLQIHGIGRAKLDRYGSIFLEVIQEHCREHSIEMNGTVPPGAVPAGRGPARRMREIAAGQGFNSGKSIESLARELNVRENRILDYLLSYLQDGHPLRAEGFLPHLALSGHELETVMEAFKTLGPQMLKPIFDALGGEVGYEDLRILRLYYLSLQRFEERHRAGASVTQDPAGQVVCLANSRKFSGRCVAGKRIVEGCIGSWIRAVSRESTGELSLKQIMLPNGDEPRLLDILTIAFQKASHHTYQSESRIIGELPWGLSGSWPISRVGELVDHASELWVNGYHSRNGLNDRMPLELMGEAVSTSLLFIEPTNLVLIVERGSRGLNRVRANFSFEGKEYCLIVTDPVIEADYLPRELGRYPVDAPKPYMTVSISEPFEDSCYKLAAALFLQPSEEPVS